MSRTPHVLNAALLALLVAGSLWAYPDLPARIPRHFSLGGAATAYWPASLVHWMLLPAVAAVTAGSVYLSVWLVGVLPLSWLNVSNAASLERLDAEGRRAIRRRLRGVLAGLAAPVLVLFGALQAGIYRVATTEATALPAFVTGTVVAALVAVLGVAAWVTLRLPAWIDEHAGSS